MDQRLVFQSNALIPYLLRSALIYIRRYNFPQAGWFARDLSKNDRDLFWHYENGITFTMPIALVETPIKSELLQYIVCEEDLCAAAMGCIQ